MNHPISSLSWNSGLTGRYKLTDIVSNKKMGPKPKQGPKPSAKSKAAATTKVTVPL